MEVICRWSTSHEEVSSRWRVGGQHHKQSISSQMEEVNVGNILDNDRESENNKDGTTYFREVMEVLDQ